MEDQKKCPQCAEMVQADAKVCRYCGHQFVPAAKSKRVGCIGIGVLLVALLFIVGKFAPPSKPPPSSAMASGLVDTTGGASGSANPTWIYDETKDQMGSVSKTATVLSDNTVDFGFPYNGEQHGRLLIRKAKDGTNVMFIVDRGQVLCHSFSNDTITVKFDDGPIRKFRCIGPADSSTETAFFSDSKTMLRDLLSSKKTVIEPNIYQQGGTQFTFTTAGLKWDR